MRILIVCEGVHETHGALAALVRRLNNRVTEVEYDRVQNTPGRVHHGKGGGYFKKAISWLLEAQRRGFDALVLLIDHDGYDERIAELDQAQENMELCPLSRAMGVAVRAFDAWMLADVTSLSQALEQHADTQPAPEEIRNPKERMRELALGAGKSEGLRDLYETIARGVRIDVLEGRCEKGFAPFSKRVRAM